ncbi:hypothetical protein [Microbacterium sp.]|uniref:hypothetical protein n=1 Tax=Microbacterium sp. TaxID=51671 RepID=UPI003C190EE8
MNSTIVKRAWTTALTVVAGVWLVALAGLPLYVFPPVDEVPPSATVLVLGPPMQARVDLAERLRDEGLAERIVVSVQASGGQTAQDLAICQDEGVTCAVADPSTTRGEVLLANQGANQREGADQVANEGANQGANQVADPITNGAAAGAAPPVIVVTSTPLVARTRYIFAKCYPGEVTVVAAGQPATLSAWAYQYVYQSLAFVKAMLEACP